MTDENKTTDNETAENAKERLKRAEERMKGEKPSIITRMRSQPYHTATHLLSVIAIGGLFAGNRKMSRNLSAEREAHADTQANLDELQGEYGELTRRAREAGVETADIGSHNTTDIRHYRPDATGTDG